MAAGGAEKANEGPRGNAEGGIHPGAVEAGQAAVAARTGGPPRESSLPPAVRTEGVATGIDRFAGVFRHHGLRSRSDPKVRGHEPPFQPNGDEAAFSRSMFD